MIGAPLNSRTLPSRSGTLPGWTNHSIAHVLLSWHTLVDESSSQQWEHVFAGGCITGTKVNIQWHRNRSVFFTPLPQPYARILAAMTICYVALERHAPHYKFIHVTRHMRRGQWKPNALLIKTATLTILIDVRLVKVYLPCKRFAWMILIMI